MDDLAGPVALEPDEAILATVPPRLLSLKDGDTFLVADGHGDISGGADGLFHHDTRVVSHFQLFIGDKRPSSLSDGLSKDNAVFTFHGANLALPPMGGRAAPRGVIHVERKRCLHDDHLFERIRLSNFSLEQMMLPIMFDYDADFRDIFEVRGMRRERRGTRRAAELTGRGVVFGYDGLDGVRRTGSIAFSEPPWRMTERRAEFMFMLGPGERIDLYPRGRRGRTSNSHR